MRVRSSLAEVQLVPGPWHDRSDYVTVKVSVPKVEADWKRSWQYIRPNGENAIKTGYRDPSAPNGVRFSDRYKDLKGKLPNLSTLDQPEVGLSDGTLFFMDGRHRFALLRDLGYSVVPVSTPREDAKEFLRRYGA